MLSSNDILAEEYEQRYALPEMFQPLPPDQDSEELRFLSSLTESLIEELTDLSPAHLSEPHKQIIPPSGSTQEPMPEEVLQEVQITQTTEVSDSQNDSTHQSLQSSEQQSEAPTKKRGKKSPRMKGLEKYKASKRKNDNNNAHKKYITELNIIIKEKNLKRQLGRQIKKHCGKFAKQSRPAFVIRMIDLDTYFGRKISEQIIMESCQRFQERFKLPENPHPCDILLHQLIEVYLESCQLFLRGDYEGSVARLYDINGAKERTYKVEGIEKVRQHLANRKI